MQYYRCKCGEEELYGSMPPSPCRGCYKCGTNLLGPINNGKHSPPLPHNPSVEWVDTDEGSKPLTRCQWCLMRMKPDEDEDPTVIINSWPQQLGQEPSYEDIIRAAYGDTRAHYTVTYDHAYGDADGSLLPGQTVKVTEKTIINAYDTSNS